MPVLPFLTIPMVWWLRPGSRHTRAALAAIVVSVLVQVPGVLVDFSKVSVAYARTGGNVPERRLYSWSESGLVLNGRAALAAVPANLGFLVRGQRPIVSTFADDTDDKRPDQPQPPVHDTESRLNRELGFSLDFWWLYLFYLGAIPAALSAAIPIVLIAAGCAALWNVPTSGEDFE